MLQTREKIGTSKKERTKLIFEAKTKPKPSKPSGPKASQNREKMLLKSHCFFGMYFLSIFLRFLVILAPKTKGLGGYFSMKFGFHRENVDFVKIIVFHK